MPPVSYRVLPDHWLMYLLLTTLACGLLPDQGVAAEPGAAAPPPVATTPVPPPSAAAAPGAWPASQEALEAMLPGDALGPSKPIVDELGGGVDTDWALTKPVTVGGVVCTKSIYTTFQGFSCTLGAVYSSESPRLSLRAGGVVTFGYGASRLSHFLVADIEPATKRVVIEGVPCADFVALGEDGHFAGCVLAEDRAFGTLVIPARSTVQKFGQLQVVAGRAFEAEGQAIPEGTTFTAELDGKLIHVFEDGEGGE